MEDERIKYVVLLERDLDLRLVRFDELILNKWWIAKDSVKAIRWITMDRGEGDDILRFDWSKNSKQ